MRVGAQARREKMKDLPQVSFIIVNFNGKQYLKKCLDSIRRQDYPKKKIEIMMVDNGSSDGSMSFVKNNYPYVKVIRNSENNYCKANNMGVEAAAGEYVAFVNNDVILDKGWLSTLIKAMHGKKSIAAAGGKIYFLDGRIQSAGQERTSDWHWKDIGSKEDEKGRYDRVKEMISLNGAAALYRKEVLREVGGFDEDLRMYYDEADMGLRLAKKKLKLFYIPKAIAHHKVEGTVSQDDFWHYLGRNRLIVMAKHAPEKLGSLLPRSELFINYDLDTLRKDIPLILSKAGLDSRKAARLYAAMLIGAKKAVTDDITSKKDREIRHRDAVIRIKDRNYIEKEQTIQKQHLTIKQINALLRQKEETIQKHCHTIEQRDALVMRKDGEIKALRNEKNIIERRKDQEIQRLRQEKDRQLQESKEELQREKVINHVLNQDLSRTKEELVHSKSETAWRQEALESIYNSRMYKYLCKPVWDVHNRLKGHDRKKP